MSPVKPQLMDALAARARLAPQRVVLPESGEGDILRAARLALDQGIAVPVLLGVAETVQNAALAAGVDLRGVEIVDPEVGGFRAHLSASAATLFPEMSQKRIEKRLRNPLSVASLLVVSGRAEAMVAGLRHTTQEVILAAAGFIPLAEGVSKPYSLFLMRIPGYDGPEGETIVFADCGVTIKPDAAQLAEIAILRRAPSAVCSTGSRGWPCCRSRPKPAVTTTR